VLLAELEFVQHLDLVLDQQVLDFLMKVED